VSAIELLADRQADWSTTANKLKNSVDRARWTILLLSVVGASLAAIASQLPVPTNGPIAGDFRTWVAVASVACLAAATFFTSRLLGVDRITSWIRARAISESLKREGFKFAAGASPYSDAKNATNRLNEERAKIEDDGDDLVPLVVKSGNRGSLPRNLLSQEEYIEQRVRGQIDRFYRPKALRYREVAKFFRRVEFALALTATLVTAVASVTGKSIIIHGSPFDVAALTAVLTTVAGSILAHIEASRFEFLVASYLATAKHLEDLLECKAANVPWSDFVISCEAIIAQENSAWMTKWKS
jgi:hypothetical protein